MYFFVEIRENPEFHDLMREDKAHWPRCLLWHGWLPLLSGVNGASPWAADASESAGYLVEAALGLYSSGLFGEWGPPDGFDAVEAASRMSNAPDVWTDGCRFLLRSNVVSFPMSTRTARLTIGTALQLGKTFLAFLQ